MRKNQAPTLFSRILIFSAAIYDFDFKPPFISNRTTLPLKGLNPSIAGMVEHQNCGGDLKKSVDIIALLTLLKIEKKITFTIKLLKFFSKK